MGGTLSGTIGNDNLTAPDDTGWTLDGKGGDDILIGAGGADILIGGGGADTMSGGAGNDIFQIGTGAGIDSFDGGEGYDVIQAVADNATIQWSSIANVEEISSGGFANAKILFGAADDVFDFTTYKLDGVAIAAGGGNDIITGSIGNDIINGGLGTDTLRGGDGNDLLDGGGGGPDILDGGNGDDLLIAAGGVKNYVGGAGYDVIEPASDGTIMTVTTGSLNGIEQIDSGGWIDFQIVGLGNVNNFLDFSHITMFDFDILSISGANANDTIKGSATADTILGLGGNDSLYGNAGDDTLDGAAGIDVLNGGAGFDALLGGDGNDTLYGGADDDSLSGDAGDDVLRGGGGSDSVDGGDGNDTIYADGGSDAILGGLGNDTIVVSSSASQAIDGGDGYDVVRAAVGNLSFHFSSLANVEEINANGRTGVKIGGTAGDDVMNFNGVALTGIAEIDGLGGNDTITGSAGADVIRGGGGLDTISGNGGTDIFVGSKSELTGDTITDFNFDDAIHVLNFGAAAATVGYDQVTNTLSIDPDGAGTAKPFTLVLQGDFTAHDFHIASDGATGSLITWG